MNRDTDWNPRNIPEPREITNINHLRRMKDHYFKEIVSFSHILGSITTILVDYIKGAFNEDFIKTTWTTSEELFSQRGKRFKEILSKPRPIMTLDPKFDPSDDSQFIPQSDFDFWVANDPTNDIWMSVRTSEPLIRGENFNLLHKIRRMKMDFNVNFIFDSDIQRIQAQNYIRMVIRHRSAIILHRYIENNIPENFIDAIANMNGFKDKKDSEEFYKFLNDRSITPITRRLRTGSGTQETFSMQHSPIEIRFNDLPSSNGPIRRGNINISSSFSESVTVEFTMDAMYILQTRDKVGEPIRKILTNHPSIENEVMKPMGSVSEKFDLIVDTPVIENYENNCVKLATIVVQADKNGTDTINLHHMLNGEICNFIDYRRDNKKPIDFLYVSVIETPDHRLGGERMEFNSETVDLTIKDMDIYKSYYITIYLDKQKMHKEEMLNFETDKFGRI